MKPELLTHEQLMRLIEMYVQKRNEATTILRVLYNEYHRRTGFNGRMPNWTEWGPVELED